jgi:hypothetical protein
MTKHPNQPVRVLALFAVIANVVFNGVYDRLGLGLADIRTVSDRYETLFTPAPYAFAIWGAIYSGLIAYAVFALLPSQRDVTVHDRIARPFILLNVLASLWVAVFTSDHPAAAVPVVAAMVLTGMTLVRRAAAGAPTLRFPHLVMAPFSLLLGWLSVATIANVSAACVAHGASPRETVWAVVMLGVALALGLLVALRFADAVFLAVVCWSSIALARAQYGASELFGDFAIGVAVLSGLASLTVTVLLLVRHYGPPGTTTHRATA